jgi:peptide/nickel transport system permease protein
VNPKTAAGAAIVSLFVLVAVGAPYLSGSDPSALDLPRALAGPSWEHPFGFDRLGRDLSSRVAHGARISLAVGLSATAISLAFGTAVGLLAGLRGGWVDEVLMRVVDVFLAFPGILLAIALAATLGPSFPNLVAALSAFGWTGYARLTRTETLSIRSRPHVEAARAIGASSARIAVRHVLPLLAPALAVQATFGFAGAIVAEASLSFLGLGLPPPAPSWGAMLDEGRAFLLVAPHLALVPAGAIFLAVIGIQFLGDGLADALGVRRPI